MSWQFLFFLTITLTRQIPHLLIEILTKKRLKCSTGKGLTFAMYLLYLFIWIWTLIQVYKKRPELDGLMGLGIFLLLFGVTLRFVGLATLGQYFTSNIAIQDNSKLIKEGVYGRVRHPIYSAMILELAGMIGFSKVIFLILPWLIMIFVLMKQAKEEDKVLLKEFGQEAKDYQTKIGAFIPRIWS